MVKMSVVVFWDVTLVLQVVTNILEEHVASILSSSEMLAITYKTTWHYNLANTSDKSYVYISQFIVYIIMCRL
jgi:hypothetical protein